MGNITIHHADELMFSYGADYNQHPYVISKSAVSWDRQEYVDPFPCYAHDENLVRKMTERVAEAFYPTTDVALTIMHYEGLGRFNGFCDVDWKYVNDDERAMGIRIVLAGKRICIHPAMTRYLVGHEYGHGVEKWLYQAMGMKDSDEFRKFYRTEIRPDEPFTDRYTARQWHSHTGEVIANDFRIVLTNIEYEYWPHEGFQYPMEASKVVNFWMDAKAKYGQKPTDVDSSPVSVDPSSNT